MRKNVVPLALAFGCLTATTLSAAPHRTLPPRLTLNDYTFTQHAVQKANTVFVPVRAIAQKLGLKISAGPHHSTVLRKNGRVIVQLRPDSHYAVIHGRTRAFAIAPYQAKGNLMVPVRAISEAAGAVVGYAASPRVIEINYRAAPAASRAMIANKAAMLGKRAVKIARSEARHASAEHRINAASAIHPKKIAAHVKDGASDAVRVTMHRPWWLIALGILAVIVLLAALRARKKRTVEVLPPPPPPEEPVIRQYP